MQSALRCFINGLGWFRMGAELLLALQWRWVAHVSATVLSWAWASHPWGSKFSCARVSGPLGCAICAVLRLVLHRRLCSAWFYIGDLLRLHKALRRRSAALAFGSMSVLCCLVFAWFYIGAAWSLLGAACLCWVSTGAGSTSAPCCAWFYIGAAWSVLGFYRCWLYIGAMLRLVLHRCGLVCAGLLPVLALHRRHVALGSTSVVLCLVLHQISALACLAFSSALSCAWFCSGAVLGRVIRWRCTALGSTTVVAILRVPAVLSRTWGM
jgi:hypothetical protein